MNKIKEFQKENGLLDDGIIGKKTLLKIKEVLNIATIEETAHFVGQCAHESGNFTADTENLNYGSDGLITTFKYDFDLNKNRIIEANEKLKANSLSRKPEAIANFVYANQNGNGNEASGDGWKFRGRGAIQLTGKANYKIFMESIKDADIMTKPDLVATKYFLQSAKFFFDKNKIWQYAKTVTTASITKVSKIINGGTNGLQDRILQTNKFYNILNK